MSYKTVLVHVDKSRNSDERIKIAAMIAMNEHAHLTGAALTGISRYLYEAGLINDNDPNLTTHLQAQLEVLRERARDAIKEFEELSRKMQVPSFEGQLIDDEPGGGISQKARCNDLVVIGQPDPEELSSAIPVDFPETVVLHSGRPVLIVPYAGRFDRIGKSALIAWDDSISATRAVTNAIPILKRVDHVEIVIFESEDEQTPDQMDADIASYLAHHGIKANVTRQSTKTDKKHRTKLDIGNALLSMATDLNSDLIVMGAYGHSRLRELLLGGVTRTVMQSMTVPVLMSH